MNIKIISNKKNWLESDAVNQVEKISLYNAIEQVIAMPDLHPGRIPVGVVAVFKDRIYPHLIGNDIGCGMNFYKLDLDSHKFKQDKISKRLIPIMENKDSLLDYKNMPFEKSIGTLGSGNHFAEFQDVEKIVNKQLAEKFAVDKKSVYLLVHSGSRGYGEQILKDTFLTPNVSKGFQSGSPEFIKYMLSHNDAIKWANLNRHLIMENIIKFAGIKQNVVKISESNHNIISVKDNLFIHRKGASEAYDYPIIIPGSRDSYSYLVMPKEKVNETYFSLAHGAGRKWNRNLCKARLSKKYSSHTVSTEKFNSRFIYKNKELVFEEAPEGYKNIQDVINSMIEEDLIEVIAILKPLLTFKG